jgi:signal transduction histidine kinase
MRVQAIPIRELVDECIDDKGILAEEYGISLHADLADPDASLRGDRRLLKAALSNLIDNAIKHNRPGGKVIIGYRCDNSRESIFVSDTGKGIPYDELCYMRDLFSRARMSGLNEMEQIDGDLIGLTIVRDVADLHGGRVGIRNLEGEGTTFSFHLPRCG